MFDHTWPRSQTGEFFEKPVLKISDVAQAFFPYLTLFQAEINFVLIVVSGSRPGAAKGVWKTRGRGNAELDSLLGSSSCPLSPSPFLIAFMIFTELVTVLWSLFLSFLK